MHNDNYLQKGPSYFSKSSFMAISVGVGSRLLHAHEIQNLKPEVTDNHRGIHTSAARLD